MRVIGVGNILLSDEGIGVHVVSALGRREDMEGIELIDGGVAGATLLNHIEGEAKVVVIDAVAAPLPPGTVVRLSPNDLKAAAGPRYSLHDLNLAEALDLMRLRDTLPEMRILGIVPADIETYRIGLSDPLAAAFDGIVEKAAREIRDFASAGD